MVFFFGLSSVFFFFFSSRRRHTRCSRDWSSDVCSSDLEGSCLVAAFRRFLHGEDDLALGHFLSLVHYTLPGREKSAAFPLGGPEPREDVCIDRRFHCSSDFLYGSQITGHGPRVLMSAATFPGDWAGGESSRVRAPRV